MRLARLLMLGLILASPSLTLAAPGYSTQVALSGTNYRPVAFNNAGDIAFQDIGASLTGAQGNVLYADGTRVALELPDAEFSAVRAVNERGQAVGGSSTCCDNIPHPVLLSNGRVTQLDINGGRLRDAYDINNAGHIAGQFMNDAGQLRAVVYDGSGYRDLGTTGAAMSAAAYINDKGQVVGVSSPFENATHAFFYSDGVMTDISVLSGQPNTSAYGLNDVGQMIGRFSPPSSDRQERGFLYEQGRFVELTPGGYNTPQAINNLGQIVGGLGIGLGDPFIWQDGSYAHLNELIDPASGYVLQVAADVNDNGQILAWACGRQDADACDVLVLTPVPEAPAWMMMAGGMGLLMLRGRARSTRSGF